MKKTLTLLGLVLGLAIQTGCTTTDSAGNTVPDTAANAKLAAAFKTSIIEFVTPVIRKNPKTAPYFAQVSAVFCKMVTDHNFNVSQLTSSLNLIPIPQDIAPYVLTAKNLIVGLYSINLQSKWDVSLDDQKFGGLLAGIVCESLSTSLHDSGN